MAYSSPPLHPQSEDDLFDLPARPLGYETVETIPIGGEEESIEPAPDTLRTIQYSQRTQTQHGDKNFLTNRHFTQPTQIVDRSSPTEISSPPLKPIVQVVASSPMMASPSNVRRPSGILASAMAPPGTTFRKPFPLSERPQERKQTSWALPDDAQFSSDSDREEQARSNIRPRMFTSKTNGPIGLKQPQSDVGRDRFSSILNSAYYDPDRGSLGVKRSSDTMADAYGNAKRPRQIGPSRAVPVGQEEEIESDAEMELDDFRDPNIRSKIRRLLAITVTNSVKLCYQALKEKKFNYDDAADHLLLLSEKKEKQKAAQRKPVDLTGSEDELQMTPAIAKLKPKPKPVQNLYNARQQVNKPVKSIAEKYSNTQTTKKDSTSSRDLAVFDTPPHQPERKGRLVKGRRNPSPEPNSQSQEQRAALQEPIVVVDDDDSGEEVSDSGIHSELEEAKKDFETRLLDFFNTCTALDLADTTGASKEIAEYIVSKQPHRSLSAIAKIEDPNLKPTKSKRKAVSIGERLLDKVEEMLRSYEAVDFLIKKCEGMAKPLANSMKAWGVDLYSSGATGKGEIDLTSLTRSPNSDSLAPSGSHDSGIGTPISDDDGDSTQTHTSTSARKGFIGQPTSISSDVTMKDYQIVGMNWLSLLYRQGLSCILADDMGLGKTLQTIAFLAYLKETGVKGPHLIVVPSATLENWLKEFQRFCPSLHVEPYYAPNPNERVELRYRIDEQRDDINVIVTTYQLAKAKDDLPWLRTFGFRCAIFDEGHVLKNTKSQVYRKLIRIQARYRLLLTGTPLQNNLQELIGLLGFLMPAMFAEKAEELDIIFKQSISTITEDASSREMLLSKRRIERARSMLTPFILRRKKWQVLKDLPKKERKVEYCEMTPQQLQIYNGWLAKAWDIRNRKANGEKVPADENSNVLMRLRQASIHPLLFRNLYGIKTLKKIAKACLDEPMFAESNPDLILTELEAYSDFEVHQLCSKYGALHDFRLQNKEWEVSGKVQAMLKLLDRFKNEDCKTLIFSQFVMVLDILEEILNHRQVKYFRLDGSTRVDQRQDLIDEFSEPGCDASVFLLSTKAGGAGINLAAANRVIVFDLGFNPQDDVQAENRAHRIGQTKDVEVWRLVTRASVEEQIYNMGVVKLKLDREVAGESVDDLEGFDPEDEKKQEELEKEGKAAVEDMFFKQLAEQEKPPNVEPAESGDVDSKIKKEEGEDHDDEDKRDNEKPENAAATSNTETELVDIKDGSDNESLTMVEPKLKRKESVELPSRTRGKGKATRTVNGRSVRSKA